MGPARQKVWLRLGVWPAFLAALLPVVVALLHLAPPVLASKPADHHQHAIHGEAATGPAAGTAVEQADEDGGCHPADRSEDQKPPRAGPHCPLCLWLKAFHALPPPDVVILWVPGGRTQFSPIPKPRLRIAAVHGAAQPRAPPIALVV